MADQSDQEREEALVSQFEAYMVEIKRLLKGASSNVKHAINSARINGYTLAELVAIIAGEVKTHEDDPNNPHNHTLAQLGGISTTNYETLAGNYFKKDALDIGKIPALPGTISGSQLTVAETNIIFRGRRLVVPTSVLNLTGTAKLYLKVNVTGKFAAQIVTLTTAVDESEHDRKLIVGILTLTNGIWSVATFPSVFVGGFRVSVTPHGRSIPASQGTQAAPNNISSGWVE